MLYVYRQNNTRGEFLVNEKVGKHVIIEADNMESANVKATSIGIYFDGVMKYWDCGCCGDRWRKRPEEINNLEDYIQFFRETGYKEYFPFYSYNTDMELTKIYYQDVM